MLCANACAEQAEKELHYAAHLTMKLFWQKPGQSSQLIGPKSGRHGGLRQGSSSVVPALEQFQLLAIDGIDR